MIFEDAVDKTGVLLLWSSPAFVLTPCHVIVCNLQPTVESQSQLPSLAQELLEAACDNHRGALTNTGVVCDLTPSIVPTTNFILPHRRSKRRSLHCMLAHSIKIPAWEASAAGPRRRPTELFWSLALKSRMVRG